MQRKQVLFFFTLLCRDQNDKHEKKICTFSLNKKYFVNKKKQSEILDLAYGACSWSWFVQSSCLYEHNFVFKYSDLKNWQDTDY
jgi:hypothetical protein